LSGRTAIIDTNVVVAGLLTADADSPPARILDAMIAGTFVFALSPELLVEYRAVLLRSGIRRRHSLDTDQVDALLESIVLHAIIRAPGSNPASAPDPGDQHLWDLLAAVPGAVLVTGDTKLADQAPGRASVVTPGAWLELLDA